MLEIRDFDYMEGNMINREKNNLLVNENITNGTSNHDTSNYDVSINKNSNDHDSPEDSPYNKTLDTYKKWYLDIYDKMEDSNADVDLFIKLIGDKPLEILEVACGSGRILAPLAKIGHTVKGFDLDTNMLSLIPLKYSQPNLTYEYMDAIKGDWGNGYDVVIMAGNLLLNVEGEMPYNEIQSLFIQKAASSLKRNGHLILDFNLNVSPNNIFAKNDGRLIYEGTDSTGILGKFFVINDSNNQETQIAEGRRLFEFTMVDGRVEYVKQNWSKHIPTLHQVHDWLNAAGLTIEKEYGDYDCNPINENTYRAIIWAMKG
jgi:2-polyprenyl-3-methyl-5-hydroxy-6-metoxy-1,4-benzoquinol methylase